MGGEAHGLPGRGLGHTGQLDNYARLGQVRKDIARINTILRDREIELAERVEQVEADVAAEPAEEDTDG